jgi:hypothetical protein
MGRDAPSSGDNGENVAQTGVDRMIWAKGINRRMVDRIAAGVGALGFLMGIVAIILGATAPDTASPTSLTTTVSSPIPGGPVTMTVQETQPPIRTNPPRVTQTTTVTEGT